MYRVLIVDDEPQIVEWLFELISNLPQLELELYKSYSASSALKWLNQAKMDIVLTDIRMPGMTGLELHEIINRNWPECRVIFLTGYNEFEYARLAMRNEAVSYILKTEDDDEIVRAVEKAAEQIAESLHVDELIVKAKQQMKAALPLMQKEYIYGLLQGEPDLPEVIQQHFDELEIPLNGQAPLLLLIGRFDEMDQASGHVDKSRALYAAKLIAERYFFGSVSVFYISLQQSDMIWLIQPRNTEDQPLWDKTLLFVKGTLETIQAACKDNLDLTISFMLSASPFAWEQLPEKYEAQMKWLVYHMGFGSEIASTNQSSLETHNADMPLKHSYSQEAAAALKMVDALHAHLEKGQKESFFKCFEAFRIAFIQGANENEELGLEMYYSAVTMLLSYMNRWRLNEKVSGQLDVGRLTRADRHDSWSEAAKYLFQAADVMFELQKSGQEEMMSDTVSRVKSYIFEHLHEGITLTKLAELVNFNPSYFSRLFKHVTGENLSHFIAEVRLEKAKAMLMESKKVGEVAAAVGFDSPAYFSRFFKKMTNLSPQDYRGSVCKR